MSCSNRSNRSKRLDYTLSRLQPFDQLDPVQKASISLWKDEFKEYDNELGTCLKALAVPQLEPYLAWIPLIRLHDFKPLAEGGFAKVFSAGVNVGENNYYSLALKELKDMIPEVSFMFLLESDCVNSNSRAFLERLFRSPTLIVENIIYNIYMVY